MAADGLASQLGDILHGSVFERRRDASRCGELEMVESSADPAWLQPPARYLSHVFHQPACGSWRPAELPSTLNWSLVDAEVPAEVARGERQQPVRARVSARARGGRTVVDSN